MKLLFKTSKQLFCILLIIRFLAINTDADCFLKVGKCDEISKDFDIEKELESKSKTNSDCADSEIDEFLQIFSHFYNKHLLYLENKSLQKRNFNFIENAFQVVHFEIPKSPPDFLKS